MNHSTISYLKSTWLLVITLLLLIGCKTNAPTEVRSTGTIERLDPALNTLIKEDAVIEIIADGYDWSEGPLWVEAHKMLLYSDVPQNKVYKWTEGNGAEVYLDPSGYTSTEPTLSTEPGANGLLLNKDGKLVLCQHGNRQMAVMDTDIANPSSSFTAIANGYEGKKLNSPNDAVYRSNGDLFFTDPPYGLPGRGNEEDSTKQIPFQGVYKVTASGEVTLLTDSITRPNGIALTPDEKTLIVANSDPNKAIWYAFDLGENDSLMNARILFDATENGKTEKGLPDGFKIDRQGNIFASGPGGVWIFDNTGKVVGKIKLDAPVSNVALADDDKTLYVTNDANILRIKMR
jgi:gluconolactonase